MKVEEEDHYTAAGRGSRKAKSSACAKAHWQKETEWNPGTKKVSESEKLCNPWGEMGEEHPGAT